jgi:galactokinase
MNELEDLKAEIRKTFQTRFSGKPLIVSSPGRINLIGEHTDYNNGFVLPAAIDKRMFFATCLNDLNVHRFYAFDLDDYMEIPLDNITIQRKRWVNYLLGVIAQFQKRNLSVPGIDCVVGGNIPIGAGLSSSAAMECGFGYSVNQHLNFEIEKTELVKMGQMAEHEFAGVKCGIMDQFASMFGKEKHALRLDCKTLEYNYFPLDMSKYVFVLCNSMVKHSLASSEYNVRRAECNEGVELMKNYYLHVESLRDVTLEQLNEHKDIMSDKVYTRCSYVLEENKRVFDLCEAMEKNDFRKFGSLLYASHDGLKLKYEVSCTELDLLVDIAHTAKGVLGARMMGGGFGGCTLNLVEKRMMNEFIDEIKHRYYIATNITPETYVVNVQGGTIIEEQ